MSTPITQAHYDLRRQVLFSAPDDGAQLIADSEARAVAQWSGGLDQSLPDLYEAAKAERDQLRDLLTEWKVSAHIKGEAIDSLLAECDRLRAEAAALKQSVESGQRVLREDAERNAARAERAEAEAERLKTERYKYTDDPEMIFTDDLGWLHVSVKAEFDEITARAELAEASLHALRLVCGATDADKFSTWVDRANARAERAELEVERLKRDYEYDHKCLCEVRDRCELWKLRAERAEAELANIRALANRRNKQDHSQDATHQLVASLDQSLDIVQAELVEERWLKGCAIKRSQELLFELATERARMKKIETALKDAISTYFGDDKLVTAERIEAWQAALKEDVK